MYGYIEQEYKTKSLLNKFVKEYFGFYISSYLLVGIFGFLSIEYYFYLWIIVVLIVFYHKILFVVKPKTFLGKLNIFNNINAFKKISKREDQKLAISLLKKIRVKNKEEVKLIIEHYRSLNYAKGHSNNFWTIVAIIFAIIMPFVSEQGINFSSLAVALPTFLSVFIIIFISNIIYINTVSFARIMSGKEQIYSRLEEMFTEIYINFTKYKKDGLN